MNPYIIPSRCSVCGEEGMLHASDLGTDWFNPVRHRDPEVCAENLARQRRNEEARKNRFSTVEKGEGI